MNGHNEYNSGSYSSITAFNTMGTRSGRVGLRPDTLLMDRYKIENTVSENATYIKYRANDRENRQMVYIYEFFPRNLAERDDNTNVIRFRTTEKAELFGRGLQAYLSEIESMRSMTGEMAVPRLLDCLIENNTAYSVWEYAEYETLADYLSEKTELEFREAREIFDRLAHTLTALHKNNIIHGNISPDHIVREIGGDTFKLTDFGVGCFVNSTGMPVYNSRYSAEEAKQKNARLTPQTEVFSMAAIYYEMLTGLVPYSLPERIGGKVLYSPRKLGIRVSNGFDNAIMNALCAPASVRYRNMPEFMKALKDKSTSLIHTDDNSFYSVSASGNSKGGIIVTALIAGVLVLCLTGMVVRGITKKVSDEVVIKDADTSEIPYDIYVNGEKIEFSKEIRKVPLNGENTNYYPLGEIFTKMGYTCTPVYKNSSLDYVTCTKQYGGGVDEIVFYKNKNEIEVNKKKITVSSSMRVENVKEAGGKNSYSYIYCGGLMVGLGDIAEKDKSKLYYYESHGENRRLDIKSRETEAQTTVAPVVTEATTEATTEEQPKTASEQVSEKKQNSEDTDKSEKSSAENVEADTADDKTEPTSAGKKSGNSSSNAQSHENSNDNNVGSSAAQTQTSNNSNGGGSSNSSGGNNSESKISEKNDSIQNQGGSPAEENSGNGNVSDDVNEKDSGTTDAGSGNNTSRDGQNSMKNYESSKDNTQTKIDQNRGKVDVKNNPNSVYNKMKANQASQVEAEEQRKKEEELKKKEEQEEAGEN